MVVLALTRERWRLALAVGLAMAGAVVTTEVLKLHVLSRPEYGGIQGIAENSYPSGHATIAMSLSLGLVMVSPRRWRRGAAIVAAVVSAMFATALLVSGWHRPSDVAGAFLVALGWFTAVTAGLVAWRGAGGGDPDDVEWSARGVVVAGGAFTAALVIAVVRSIRRADQVVLVTPNLGYVLACAIVDALGVAVVAVYFVLLTHCSLDLPPPARDSAGTGRRSLEARPTVA